MTQLKTFSLITLSQVEVYQHLQAALRAEGVDVDLENLSLVADEKTGGFVVQAANVRIRPAEPPRSLIAPPSMSLAEARRMAEAEQGARRGAEAEPAPPRRLPAPPAPVDQEPPAPRGPFRLSPSPAELGPPVEFDFNAAARSGAAPLGPPPSQAEVNGPPRRRRPAVETVEAAAEPVLDQDDLARLNRQLRQGPAYNRPVRGSDAPASFDDMGRDHALISTE